MGGVTDGQTVISGLKSIFHGNAKGKWKPFHFVLFTKFTPIILLILAGLIFWQRMSNEHINCYAPPDEDIRTAAVNQYCFVTGTYTVTGYFGTLRNSKHLPYPGIGPRIPSSDSNNGGSKVKYHFYFQWVPFVLLVQAILFTVPNLMWKSLHKDTLSRYCNAINDKDAESIEQTSRRFRRNLRNHSSFSGYFISSELANLVVVLFSFQLADMLLTGQFFYLGRDWLHYLQTTDQHDQYDFGKKENSSLNPLDRIFPKMSKCEFKKYGPGGGIINYDLLCVMTLNVLHDKVFLFIWFWFLLLIALQSMYLFYYLVLFRIGDLRFKAILSRVEFAFLKNEKDPKENRKKGKAFLRTLGYNDRFLLMAISSATNTEPFTLFFEYLVTRYHAEYMSGTEASGQALTVRKNSINKQYSNRNLIEFADKEKTILLRNNASNHVDHKLTLYSPLNESLKEMSQLTEQMEAGIPLINATAFRNDSSKIPEISKNQQTQQQHYNYTHHQAYPNDQSSAAGQDLIKISQGNLRSQVADEHHSEEA